MRLNTRETMIRPLKALKRPSVPLEHDEQARVVTWARWQPRPGGGHIGDLLCAIPNGGSRHRIEAARLKAEGVKRGMPDLFLAIPCEGHHGLFIEMKRKKGGRVSDAQNVMIDRLNAEGYQTCVCYGADEAITAIKTYLGL